MAGISSCDGVASAWWSCIMSQCGFCAWTRWHAGACRTSGHAAASRGVSAEKTTAAIAVMEKNRRIQQGGKYTPCSYSKSIKLPPPNCLVHAPSRSPEPVSYVPDTGTARQSQIGTSAISGQMLQVWGSPSINRQCLGGNYCFLLFLAVLCVIVQS